jgi:hypothetical protein
MNTIISEALPIHKMATSSSPPLIFVKECSGQGVFKYGGVTIDVSNSCAGTEYDTVRKILAGDRTLTAEYPGCEGDSEFAIYGDTFSLKGGSWGPMSGGGLTIDVSYSQNKAAIDAFMAFMLEEDDDDS